MLGLLLLVFGLREVSASETLILSPGYVYKVRCEGKLLASAVGNEQLLRIEALPKELGCGVILKPLGLRGQSNLILETSVGTVIAMVEVGTGLAGNRKPGEAIVVGR